VAPVAVAVVLVLAGEVIGRWLFYVTVVPANMPGSFWRSTAGSHR
jgi:DMSO reductase anchor subunit